MVSRHVDDWCVLPDRVEVAECLLPVLKGGPFCEITSADEELCVFVSAERLFDDGVGNSVDGVLHVAHIDECKPIALVWVGLEAIPF